MFNRLEGKHNVIKGVDRNPKNESKTRSNYQKVFDYLSQLEKMNPRYFHLIDNLIQGDEDVFWGLLFDIYLFYH